MSDKECGMWHNLHFLSFCSLSSSRVLSEKAQPSFSWPMTPRKQSCICPGGGGGGGGHSGTEGAATACVIRISRKKGSFF